MAKRQKFCLRARRDNVTELSPIERKAAARVWDAMSEWLAHETPTLVIGQMAIRIKHIPGLRDLTEELRLLDQWTIGTGDGVWFISESIQFNMLLRFLDRFVERAGWYPAMLYKDYYGIKAATLRQQVKRGKLASIDAGTQVLYPFDGVRTLWPQLVTFLPEVPNSGATRRNKRDKP